MFHSSGFFHNAPCPFYQHGLCHRPYCHFQHISKDEDDEVLPAQNVTIEDTGNSKGDEYEPNQNENDENDEEEMMKIVKNISPSKLIAYAQRKKEERELNKKLQKIQKESEEKLAKERYKLHTKLLKKGELTGGLIDNFYKKDAPIVNIITPLNQHDSPQEEDETPAQVLEKQICDCDDPACSGFIEHDENDTFEKEVNKISDDEKTTEVRKRRRKKKRKKPENDNNDDNTIPTKKQSIVDSIANLEALVSMKKKELEKVSDDDSNEVQYKSNVNKKTSKSLNEKTKVSNMGVTLDLEKEAGTSFLDLFDTNMNDSNKVNERSKDEVTDKVKNSSISLNVEITKPKVMTGQDSLKKRVAHSTEEVSRIRVEKKKNSTKLSYISPGLAAPITSKPSQNTEVSNHVSESLSTIDTSTENGVYIGKKRTAHAIPKKLTTSVDTSKPLERPKLPMEFNSKIPHALRQRYLDKIIDELIPKCESESEAYAKALEEEAVANQRSTRRQIYLNLCVQIIKRVRSLPSKKRKDVNDDENEVLEITPFDAGKPTVDTRKRDAIAKQTAMRLQNSSLAGYKKAVPKGKIKAPSSTLINAKLEVNKSAKVNSFSSKRRLSTESAELTEENFYRHLYEKYLLTDGQLWENRYPQYSEDKSTIVVKDYEASKNPLKRICCRCGKDYFMNAKGKYITRDECHYHWGRLRKQREKGVVSSYFSCCRADPNDQPCCISRLHVCDKVGELTGFVSTENWVNDSSQQKVLALDCEMCYTTQGLELTRLTVVDFNLDQIIDLFVKPKNPIVDYNTRFSGVSKENLQDTTTNIDDIHDILSNIIDSKTILIGHSLESDLNALKMVHRTVVDTALVFPHRLGLPFKRALRTLMGEFLQKIIQNEESGHDSCEDARSCMELMRFKFKEDMKKVSRNQLTSTGMALKSFYSNKSNNVL